jgi:hypothetical protein
VRCQRQARPDARFGDSVAEVMLGRAALAGAVGRDDVEAASCDGARTPALMVAVIAGAVAEYTVDWRWARRKHEPAP